LGQLPVQQQKHSEKKHRSQTAEYPTETICGYNGERDTNSETQDSRKGSHHLRPMA